MEHKEQVMELDVHTQILYNRVIAQMGALPRDEPLGLNPPPYSIGIKPSRRGERFCIVGTQTFLGYEFSPLPDPQTMYSSSYAPSQYNKVRELLAQGYKELLFFASTPEQERAERQRQLHPGCTEPYHMHINLEVLESAHHISAMLLEVPNLAMQSIDPNNKRVISRVLRRSLEQYDKQIFTGPPENAKEAVVASAKALQRGDWLLACSALEDQKLWVHIDPGNPENGQKVKAMITDKIKTEALRTYLFAYSSIYDAFHLDQLVAMFGLEPIVVHSIISRMMIKEATVPCLIVLAHFRTSIYRSCNLEKRR
ncbi:unnamed protein product [Polarella glacialis]|uniref:Eukaryotic translation initiation factor 3 subunit C N-terminal domain-containing protein n=1 Tax=Polarella glacialis TaxID=89957 RepID=A0A813FE35_POLGL|nr:unnamed protein product [Polarella glacialis]